MARSRYTKPPTINQPDIPTYQQPQGQRILPRDVKAGQSLGTGEWIIQGTIVVLDSAGNRRIKLGKLD